MSTGNAVALGLVGVAVVGGVVWYVNQPKKKSGGGSLGSGGGALSTGDKIGATIIAAAPIVGSLVALWS